MKAYPLASDVVALEVLEVGAMLGDVTFDVQGRKVTPMHVAPWVGEALPPDMPPMLRNLRGDFLAAPFGDSDVLEEERHAHGRTANGRWGLIERGDARLELELDAAVMGASVRVVVELLPGHPVVYQRHSFRGGEGRLPVGHHAMLRARSGLRLSFAPWRWAGTPPAPVEVPPQGRSALRYPQRIHALERARLADGGATDLTRFPVLEDAEDLWMLSSREDCDLGWTAAVCADEGWAWFALKDPRVLPSTVVWMSNGGRDYPPFSGRHRGVIGLEEVCANFHLGHRASLEGGAPARAGAATTVELAPARTLDIPYLFGVSAIPDGFDAVREIVAEDRAVVLLDRSGRSARVPCDPGFLQAVPVQEDR